MPLISSQSAKTSSPGMASTSTIRAKVSVEAGDEEGPEALHEVANSCQGEQDSDHPWQEARAVDEPAGQHERQREEEAPQQHDVVVGLLEERARASR